MRLVLLICLLTFFNAKAQNLDKYLWKNRVILIFENTNGSEQAIKQKSMFAKETTKMDDRAIILLKGNNELKLDLGFKKDFQGVVLIGKDGGVKFSGDFLVKPETLFSLIDGMPMRKAEIRRKGD